MIISINGFTYDILSSYNRVDIIIYEREKNSKIKYPLELTETNYNKTNDPEEEGNYTTIEFKKL